MPVGFCFGRTSKNIGASVGVARLLRAILRRDLNRSHPAKPNRASITQTAEASGGRNAPHDPEAVDAQMVRASQGETILPLLHEDDRWNNEVHVLTISEDDAGSLIIKIHGGLEIVSEEDEAALLARLLDRAGGLQNLALWEACKDAEEA